MADKTLFQKIADREIPADIIYEDDLCICFRDIDPQAPFHVLVVPRKVICTIDDISPADEKIVGHLFVVASKVAAENGFKKGYRVAMNCGDDGGQTVYHIHLHVLGGRKLTWPPG